MTVRFDEAWTHCFQVAERVAALRVNVIVLRDMTGKVSLLVDDTDGQDIPPDIEAELRDSTGAFAGAVLSIGDLFTKDDVRTSPDLVVARREDSTNGRISILERGIVGGDWTRPDNAVGNVDNPANRRVTLYGFKGGVGRSTATFMLAQHLASQDKCVLVADLDLESPGIGPLLNQSSELPDHGIVDHLVESAVNNAEGLSMTTRSLLGQQNGNGEVWLAPAGGRPRAGYSYLPKLNRVYSDSPRRRFGARLDDALLACEREVEHRSRKPDITLIDSRAGIHDIAAVSITQLSNYSLLFAADNTQTWAGYRSLFDQWRRAGVAPTMRERIKLVASMTPSNDDDYLLRFQDNAQECFADALYDNADSDDVSAFNFSPHDETAPHFPLAILFSTDLVGLNPVRRPHWHSEPLVNAAYEQFLDSADRLILGEEEW